MNKTFQSKQSTDFRKSFLYDHTRQTGLFTFYKEQEEIEKKIQDLKNHSKTNSLSDIQSIFKKCENFNDERYKKAVYKKPLTIIRNHERATTNLSQTKAQQTNLKIVKIFPENDYSINAHQRIVKSNTEMQIKKNKPYKMQTLSKDAFELISVKKVHRQTSKLQNFPEIFFPNNSLNASRVEQTSQKLLNRMKNQQIVKRLNRKNSPKALLKCNTYKLVQNIMQKQVDGTLFENINLENHQSTMKFSDEKKSYFRFQNEMKSSQELVQLNLRNTLNEAKENRVYFSSYNDYLKTLTRKSENSPSK